MSKKKKIRVDYRELSKDFTRYQVRNTLFRMRDNRVENDKLAKIVWGVIQPQLQHPEGLKNFTFDWDVDSETPTKVIRREDWDAIKAEKYPDEYKMQAQVEEEITMFTAQE